jgi:hypothetical protein
MINEGLQFSSKRTLYLMEKIIQGIERRTNIITIGLKGMPGS